MKSHTVAVTCSITQYTQSVTNFEPQTVKFFSLHYVPPVYFGAILDLEIMLDLEIVIPCMHCMCIGLNYARKLL